MERTDGRSSGTGRLHGAISELLLLPTTTGADVAADAARQLRLEPRIALHEAAVRSGARPTLSLHPAALTLHGSGVALGASQLGARDASDDDPRSAACVRVHRSVDPRDAIVGMGGVRVPLLRIGQLAASL